MKHLPQAHDRGHRNSDRKMSVPARTVSSVNAVYAHPTLPERCQRLASHARIRGRRPSGCSPWAGLSASVGARR